MDKQVATSVAIHALTRAIGITDPEQIAAFLLLHDGSDYDPLINALAADFPDKKDRIKIAIAILECAQFDDVKSASNLQMEAKKLSDAALVACSLFYQKTLNTPFLCNGDKPSIADIMEVVYQIGEQAEHHFANQNVKIVDGKLIVLKQKTKT